MIYVIEIVKMLIRPGFKLLISLFMLQSAWAANADNSLTLDVLGEQVTLEQHPATGDQLILYIAPWYGFNERSKEVANNLAGMGIEVWMVDLIENYFLPYSVDSIRLLDGSIVANIIEQAHTKTGKNITLFTSSYGAIPLLKGARQWQLNNSSLSKPYLNGAIMFSPELYNGVPALGEDPEFEPIASATNIPVMIYQSALRNNRWQLDNVIQRLEKGNAVVYQKVLPNIASFFYKLTDLPDAETTAALNKVPTEFPSVIRLLQSTPTPLKAAELQNIKDTKSVGLDTDLRKYRGKKTPKPIDLVSLDGKRIVRKDYKNKVTIINFWATWCPPCVEEIPMLNRLKAEMKDESFELISINYGEDRAIINKFLEKVNVHFPVLLDEGGRVSGEWNIIILPSTYVIGPDGRFAYSVNAAIEWDKPQVVQAMKDLVKQK